MSVVIKFPLERVKRSTSGNFGSRKTAEIVSFSKIGNTVPDRVENAMIMAASATSETKK